MTRTMSTALVAMLMAVSQAAAYSGAEMLKSPKHFVDGFAYGVVSRHVLIVASEAKEPDAEQKHIQECFTKNKITSDVLGDAVLRHIKDDPAMLAQEGVGVVLTTVFGICGPTSD